MKAQVRRAACGCPPPPCMASRRTHRGLPHGDVLQATQDLHSCRKVSVLIARFRNQQKFGQQSHLQLKRENGVFSVLQLQRTDGGEHFRAFGKNTVSGPKEACAPSVQ